MCGIAGQVGLDDFDAERLTEVYEDMKYVLRRRGPDQSGVYIDRGTALIHTRLCVIDVENGRQPMEFREGPRKFVLVYNGELYNTDELREELTSLGHNLTTRSDTEILGRAYMQWGEDVVEHLNGIFAFAVWEEYTRRLFLARDRIGVKPLFYALRGGTIIFASEIKALLRHPMLRASADETTIAELILLGPGHTPGSGVFRGIYELEGGMCATYTQRGFSKRRYWELTDGETDDTYEQAVEKVRALVVDAVQRQLVSDVPVCTFLSGGLDSSAISSIADGYMRSSGERLRTFSVGYRDNEKYFKAGVFQPNSDSDYIGYMNDALAAEHFDVTLDNEELADALYEAVDARDLPGMADVDASLLLFCREIKKHATVALSGECADEIFGGYPWYTDREVRSRSGFPWARSDELRASFLRPEFTQTLDVERYAMCRYDDTVRNSHVLPSRGADERRMREMVNLNFKWFMQTLLTRKDAMSMYSGLEVRVPFCDHRIAEYLYTLPWEYKNRGGVEKGLLRDAVSDLLPREILERKKSPYPKTHNPRYLAIVSERLRAVLSDGNSPLLDVVRREALEALLDSRENTPWYGQLMTTPQTIAYFLQFNYWLTKYHVDILV
ncbi:MAG: asparagine synthase (glutamine-hydrolyzing) [Oscillospiraceae bacterium]|jgi:asparagine synthase (glutamine-hydrolysing)|nr:asparagine synthase (glutamine-hydrolyzing) [Oscillospiraceae bacterium]